MCPAKPGQRSTAWVLHGEDLRAPLPCLAFPRKNQDSLLNPASHPILLQWLRRGMSPKGAWHLGTTPRMAVAPSRAVSHPQSRAMLGGSQIRVAVAIYLGVTASSKGSPDARVRFRRGDGLPGGRNRSAMGSEWEHRASPGQDRASPRSTLLLLF